MVRMRHSSKVIGLLALMGISYLLIQSLSMYSYLGRTFQRYLWNPTETPYRPQDDNILFIGNSYTGYNHLAQLIKQALEAGMTVDDPADDVAVHVESHTPPGETFAGHEKGLEQGHTFQRYSFDYFYRGTHLRRWLLPPSSDDNNDSSSNNNKYYWKWITLQNFSTQPGLFQSSDAEKRAIFDESLEAAKYLNDIIAKHHPDAKTLFIMTWGRPGRDSGNPELYPDFPTMQALLQQGYQQYVDATSTPSRPTYLAPVGLVFQTIYNDLIAAGIQDPTAPGTLFYQLYDKGDHHPSLAGSYVMALTIYATMTGKQVMDLNWVPNGLESDMAATLRDAVSRTIQETVDKKSIQYPWQS